MADRNNNNNSRGEQPVMVDKRDGYISRPLWVADATAKTCAGCKAVFSVTVRKHHCRMCGKVYCYNCSNQNAQLPLEYGYSSAQRVCGPCHALLASSEKQRSDMLILVQYHLRGFVDHSLVQAVPEIGQRRPPFKHVTLIRHEKTKQQALVSLLVLPEATSAMYNSDSKRRHVSVVMGELKHPNLAPFDRVEFLSNKEAIVVRPFYGKGSLKDRIALRANPLKPYLTKYQNPKTLEPIKGMTVGPKLIAKFGRELLEVIYYLQQRNMPCLHVHSGNVLLDNDTVLLSEIENNLLGLEPYHIAQIRANTHLTPEVVCFGHVLFEMTVGQPFSGTETDLTGVKGVCPPEVYEILHSIFVRREGAEVPSIKSLMAHSYFAVDMTRLTTGMKWDGKSKTIIKAAAGLCTAMYASAGGATENDSNNVPPVTVTSPSTKPSKKSKATADDLPRTRSSRHVKSPSDSNKRRTMAPGELMRAQSALSVVPPPPPGPPPPPPPAVAAAMPASQTGRSALLDAIRNPSNLKSLKKVK